MCLNWWNASVWCIAWLQWTVCLCRANMTHKHHNLFSENVPQAMLFYLYKNEYFRQSLLFYVLLDLLLIWRPNFGAFSVLWGQIINYRLATFCWCSPVHQFSKTCKYNCRHLRNITALFVGHHGVCVSHVRNTAGFWQVYCLYDVMMPAFCVK